MRNETMKKTNALIVISAILLLALAIISVGYAAWQSFGMNSMFIRGSQLIPQGLPSRPENGLPPSDQQQPPDSGGFPMTPPSDLQGRIPQDGQTRFPGGFGGPRGGFGLLRWLGLGIYSLALILAIVSAVFLLRVKRWAAILAIILAGALLISTLLSLFGRSSTIGLILGVVRVLLGIGVIVLLLLPKSRAIWNHHQVEAVDDDDDDEDEDDDDKDDELLVSQTSG